MKKITLSHRAKAQHGFTLLEMMIAVSLMGLLFTGVMNLFIAATRTTMRTQAQIYATNDAANSIQNVVGQLREAQSFALPTGSVTNQGEEGWIPLTGATLDKFSTTFGTETINTGLQLKSPPALSGPANGYTAANGALIQVQNASASIAIPSQPYESTAGGSTRTVLIYRGDPDGTPDANPSTSTVAKAGTYLWQYAIPADQTFNLLSIADPDPKLRNPVVICKSVSMAPNAVQFVRPVYGGSVGPPAVPGTPEKWQVEIKIISGYYSPINGTQTMEGGNGVSQLSGKCVYMRDHDTKGAPPSAGTQSSNNAFQHN